MNVFKMPQHHCDGLSKDEVYYGTPSMFAVEGVGDYKFLALIDKAKGTVAVGLRSSEPTRQRPEMDWINFPSVELFNIFVSACENLQKELPKEKASNLFLFGYPGMGLPNSYDKELESFNYEETESPIGKKY